MLMGCLIPLLSYDQSPDHDVTEGHGRINSACLRIREAKTICSSTPTFKLIDVPFILFCCLAVIVFVKTTVPEQEDKFKHFSS